MKVEKSSTEYEHTTALYYGDSNVKIGDSFFIICIIPVNEPIQWLKDDVPITLHNLRHGGDDHSYKLSESEIEGERHKIEANISVRHALKAHEGKYRCNDVHSNYHQLHVHAPIEVVKLQTQSPFLLSGGDHNHNKNWPHQPTESMSVYETISDLSQTSTMDDIFTHTWEKPGQPPGVLPTPKTAVVTVTTSTASTSNTHQHHHHHHHQQQQQQKQPLLQRERNKLVYKNATNYDINSYGTASNDSHENVGLINLEYMPTATNRTEHFNTRTQTSSTSTRYPPMPEFPPPRIATSMPIMPTPPPYYSSKQPYETARDPTTSLRFPLQTELPVFVNTYGATPTSSRPYNTYEQQHYELNRTPRPQAPAVATHMPAVLQPRAKQEGETCFYR